ncbi:hypothetical protein CSB11_00295 [Candidatus Campbellbacteria bacterium]|nr:MAG: hypothetical protein CSB11_00295 [Candidatus Campbellbacteria bacterium]
MNLTIPIILILASIGLFFTWIDPQYKEVQDLMAEKKAYEKKEQDLATIRNARKKLSDKYNQISVEKRKRLERLLPNHMDNVELIVDIDKIAKKDNIRIKDISLVKNFETKKAGKAGAVEVESKKGYKSVNLSFSFNTTYEKFKNFVEKLRKSLRLVDIVSIKIVSAKNDRGSNAYSDSFTGDNYKFSLVVRAYWLKK